VATWSLRERAVCSRPADRAGELGQPPLDGHVDVLVGRREREAPVAQLGLDGVEAGLQGLAVLRGDDRARDEHPRVRRATARGPRARAGGRSRQRR
jgi:hypothetical protein